MGTAAKTIDVSEFVGNGRKRKQRLNHKRQWSHKRRAIWLLKDDGQRIPIELDFSEWSRKRAAFYLRGVRTGEIKADPWLHDVRKAEAGSPDDTPLISTTYSNPSTGTLTCYGLAFDLDFDKAADQFKTGDKVDWLKVSSFLDEHEPAIVQRIGAVASSTSGRGLGILIPISPIELNSPGSIGVEDLARKLQKRIIKIFNFHGLGADPDALGLERWMPNFCNPKKIVDIDFVAKQKTERRRDRVIKELLTATDDHPALAYVPKKSHKDDFIYHYAPVESKLAKLYLHLLDDVGLDDHMQITIAKLSAWLKISGKTLRKILREGLCWLGVQHIGGREGYRLLLQPTLGLTDRARALVEGKAVKTAQDFQPMRKLLIPPDQVQDGDRYDWRGNVLLSLKLRGADQPTAIRCLELLREQVPDGIASRSLTSNLKAGVKSFWTKRLFNEDGSEVIGSRPGLPIPTWLKSALTLAEKQLHEEGKHFYRKAPLGGRDIDAAETHREAFSKTSGFSSVESSAAPSFGKVLPFPERCQTGVGGQGGGAG